MPFWSRKKLSYPGNIANTVAEINRKDIEELYKKMF